MSYEEKLKLKKKLKFTWEIFFSRFGNFTKIQEAAIPFLLEGHNCLLSARTAGGKTEAATAPLIERLKNENWKGLSIIYISPTRALVTDLYNRLLPRLEDLSITIRQRTGDSSYINFQKPPQVLITTPESFDVLLTREPRMFINVQGMILDEIHLIDNSVRGDQLRFLLNRLRSIRRNAFARQEVITDNFQTVLLSATVSNPMEVAERYCQDAKIIEVTEKREIKAELFMMKDDESILSAISKFKNLSIRKVLVFCNSRAECERVADYLKGFFTKQRFNPFGENIFVHHSSLDKQVRRETEELFNKSPVGICFATSTLELGIDIGDIDLVILIAPPSDLGSFLQRIGRGNRRTSKTTFWGLYRNEREYLLFQILLEQSKVISQSENKYTFRPSILVQQVLSYLQQRKNGSFGMKEFERLVEEESGSFLLNKMEREAFLSHLVSERLLNISFRNEYTPGERATELYEKFQQYSNIQSGGIGIRVIDELTGKVLGEIEEKDLKNNHVFSFGGKRLNVVRNEKQEIIVTNKLDEISNKTLRFYSIRAPLPISLAQKIARKIGLKEREFCLIRTDNEVVLIHGLGTIYGRMLSQILKSQFGWKTESDDLCLRADEVPSKISFEFEPNVISEHLKTNRKNYEKLLNLGKFQSYLPEFLRQKSIENGFDISRFCEIIKDRRVTEIELIGELEILKKII